MGQIPRTNGYIIQLVQGARRVRGFLHGFGSSLVMRLCEGFSDGFRSQNLDLVVGFKHFLFIDELHHFSRWLLHHQPVTTSYFQFLEPESSQDPVLEPTVVAFHVSLQPRSWSVFGGSVDHFTRTVLFGLLVCFGHVSGWWFGTWLLFSHNIWGNPSAIDELIFFRGVGIPPTRCRL